MKESNVVLCAPVRTAIGTYGGTLKDTPAPGLGAIAIAESLRRELAERMGERMASLRVSLVVNPVGTNLSTLEKKSDVAGCLGP